MAMDELKVLTDNLLPPLVKDTGRSYKVYSVDQGECLGFELLANEKIAVQKNFSRAGTIFPKHCHEEAEIMVVYEGQMEIHFDANTVTPLGVGEHIFIEANTPHWAVFPVDTWIIALTIPPAAGYPGVQDDP